MSNNQTEISEQFIDRMGLIIQAVGLPRTAGRLFGLMALKAGPFSFSDLEKCLQVSRGSISANTRLLENIGIIERISKPGARQDYFWLAKDPYVRLLQGIAYRMNKAEKTVRETQNALSDTMSQQRLEELANFYQDLAKVYQRLAGNMTKTGEAK